MEQKAARVVTDVDSAVDSIIETVGSRIVLGMPLGLGKPVELANALFRRACDDADLHLKILTALSLEIPRPSSDMESRFLTPFLERVFAGVPQLDYMKALRDGRLPPNVEVCEFFFKPGSLMNNRHAQQNYISSNYTHAARDVFNQGCNVAAQAVCRCERDGGTRYSLSCNADTGPELLQMLRASGRPHVAVAQVNQKLPFMVNDAEVGPEEFDLVIDHERYATPLFSTPKMPVATPDYLIGLQASALLKDGGTLQVGIGALGDAVVHAACLRQQHNDDYREILEAIGVAGQAGDLIADIGGVAPFEQGLYGATEMLVDGFMPLHQTGILKRRVYDFGALQQLVNEGRCDPGKLTPEIFAELEALGVRVIRTQDFDVLQHHGLFNDATAYEGGHIVAPEGTRVIANVADPEARRVMGEQCLGERLRNGIFAHGGFFLGPRAFYAWLRDLEESERAGICMTGVYKVNQLDHNPRLYKQQRVHARFINTGIMATLSGAVVSDGLDDGRVISGVGGQYNFVSMAHQLPTGRSIIMIRSVRGEGENAISNLVFNYGHCTIPRHLRDIVITEYGIADLRSKSDSDVIKALVNVTDSRFQTDLLQQAREAGKVASDYEIPEAYRHNTPETLQRKVQRFAEKGLLPAFPFGSDLTDQEITLAAALKQVKARADATPRWKLLLALGRFRQIPPSAQPYLKRMNLTRPTSIRDKVARMLLVQALRDSKAV